MFFFRCACTSPSYLRVANHQAVVLTPPSPRVGGPPCSHSRRSRRPAEEREQHSQVHACRSQMLYTERLLSSLAGWLPRLLMTLAHLSHACLMTLSMCGTQCPPTAKSSACQKTQSCRMLHVLSWPTTEAKGLYLQWGSLQQNLGSLNPLSCLSALNLKI